jgi:hypothetical protein
MFINFVSSGEKKREGAMAKGKNVSCVLCKLGSVDFACILPFIHWMKNNRTFLTKLAEKTKLNLRKFGPNFNKLSQLFT